MPHSDMLLEKADQPVQLGFGACLRFSQPGNARARCLDEPALRVRQSLYLRVGAILPLGDVRLTLQKKLYRALHLFAGHFFPPFFLPVDVPLLARICPVAVFWAAGKDLGTGPGLGGSKSLTEASGATQ